MGFFDRLDDLGFEKVRRAVALLALGFFTTLYSLIALNAPEGWELAFAGLAVCYVTAFVALASEWFWGRWFASGLGWYGVLVGAFALLQLGAEPPLVIFTVLHGVVVVTLLGKRMEAAYDGQESFRQKFAMDDFGVARLRKTVTRTAASLPAVIMWALAPKQDESLALTLLAPALGVAVALGLRAVVGARTWGLVALSTAAVGLVAVGPAGVTPVVTGYAIGPTLFAATAGTVFGGVLLALAVLPFAGPAWAYLTSRGR